jgi:hypothetical protein
MSEERWIERGYVENRISEPELAALINPEDPEAEKVRLQNNQRSSPYSHLCEKDGRNWFWRATTPNQD